MPEVITRTDLENARVDAQALEQVMNGGSSTTVSLRLGGTVPSISKLIANSSALLASLGFYTYEGDWLTGSSYSERDVVRYLGDGKYYVALTAHTAGTFATDLAADKWQPHDLVLNGITSRLVIGDDIAVGREIPLAPIHVGGATLAGGAADAQIVISREVGDESAVSGHAFADYSTINRDAPEQPNGIGYNGFDFFPVVGGSYDYDHMSGFQARPQIDTEGTTVHCYGFYYAPIINNGELTNSEGLFLENVFGDGDLVNDFGIYVKQRNKGSALNYEIFSNAAIRVGKPGNGDQFVIGSTTTKVYAYTDLTNFYLTTDAGAGGSGISASTGTVALMLAGLNKAVLNSDGLAVVGVVKPSSYTVAGLPSAATVGAGAMAWCSNASAGATLVTSNGSVWKIAGTQTTVS